MSKLFFYLSLMCTTLLLFVGSILFVSSFTFDFSVHDAPYDMVAVSQLSEQELTYAFEDTVHYLYDGRDTLDTTLNNEALFNQKEIKHMKEVKVIFQLLIRLFILLITIFIALLIYLFKYREKVSLPPTWKRIVKQYFWGVFLFFILIGLAMIFFFEPLFILFHQIVFQNDDWLFSLSSDHLIQFLPEQFFFKRAIQIAILFTLLHTLVTFVTYRLCKGHTE